MERSVENLVALFESRKLSRRQLIQGLLAVLAASGATSVSRAGTDSSPAFRGRTLNHVTLSVNDVQKSTEFYTRLLGGTIMFETEKGAKVEGVTLGFPESFLGIFKLGQPGVHHFCVGVEDFSMDRAHETLKTEFPDSNPTIFRGEELYFRDPDGTLGQVSGLNYRGPRKAS